MNTSRRDTLKSALTLMAGTALPGLAAAAQTPYPVGIIKIIISTPAGGGGDAAMRIVGQKLTEVLGNVVVVEAKPGANGAIAIQSVAKAAPDGLTLLYIN